MDENEKAQKLISRGAELTGAAAGGAIGFFAGGPIGAATGSAAGPVITWSLQRLGKDFANRMLSSKEEAKVGASLIFAYGKIEEYLKQGRTPRNDHFFNYDTTGWSASDEILEGVLLKCKNEHEIKKLKFVSTIYANVAFMPDVSVEGANWLLQKAQELTYRQLCVIALIKQAHNKGVSWGPNDGDPAFEMEYKSIDEMFSRDHSPRAVKQYEETGEGLDILGLSRTGEFCYRVMGLHEIPEADLRRLSPRFPRAFTD
ncbi:MAG: hypothetical protein M3R24_12935 [Chloroflexota bacterium]|nr:hypothetical protein [Chloroflexota bacterium]